MIYLTHLYSNSIKAQIPPVFYVLPYLCNGRNNGIAEKEILDILAKMCPYFESKILDNNKRTENFIYIIMFQQK